jgi:outer membrane protein
MYKPMLTMVLAACLLAGRAAAGPSPPECDHAAEDDCVATRRWNFNLALGAGVRTNPLENGKDIPLVVIPQFSYYGKRFFIDDLDLGYTLWEGAANTVSLVASPGYDRVFFYRTDLQNLFINGFSTTGGAAAPGLTLVNRNAPGAVPYPARARKVTYLAGPEWTFKQWGVTGQLDVLHEVTGQNGGDEVRAAAAVPLWKGTGALNLNFGLTWKSRAIVNYYYGEPNGYQGGSALNPFVKLGYTRPLGGKWRLNAFVHHEHLGKAVRDSPIVEGDTVETVFVGAVYDF